MARKPRLHKPGAFYHVLLRGINGESIFFSPEDRCKLCQIINQGVVRYGHKIHAFCFMPTYINLIIQPGKVALSRIMQHLACRYAMHVNQSQQRMGPLFQDRYKAFIVNDVKYLCELVRHIHLDPLRSGLVSKLTDYPWNGQRAYEGAITVPWLTIETVLGRFHADLTHAQDLYCKFVAEGLSIELPEVYRIRPEENFVEQEFPGMAQESPKFTIVELLTSISDMLGVSLTDLQSTRKHSNLVIGRSLAALIVRNQDNLSLTQLATYLLKAPEHMSRLATNIERKALADAELTVLIQKVMDKAYATSSSS